MVRAKEGQIQIAFDAPGDDLVLTAAADKAFAEFYDGYIMQSLMNGDDSAETQIRENAAVLGGATCVSGELGNRLPLTTDILPSNIGSF